MNAKPETEYNTVESLDPLLGPCSASHSGSSGQATVLAVLAKANRHKLPMKLVRIWIQSRLAKRPEVVQIATSNAWSRLVRISQDWIREMDLRSSSSLAAAVARRGLARVLSEIKSEDQKRSQPVSGIRQVAVRHAAAVMALEGIRVAYEGRDVFGVSYPWLGVQRGTTKLAAGQHFKILTRDLGWVRVVSGGRNGVPSWVRFPKLPGKLGALVEGEERYRQIGAISSLEEPTDYLAAIFRSANHPAWTYSPEYKPIHWLVLLADAAGVDPASLGVASSRLARLRKDLFILLGAPEERTAETLMQALDDHGFTSGAVSAFEAAEEARRIAAQERREEAQKLRAEKRAAAEAKATAKEDEKRSARLAKEEAKVAKTDQPVEVAPAPAEPVVSREEAIKQQAERLMPMLYGKVGSLPQPADGVEVLRIWIYSATPLLAECQAPLRTAIAHLLFADAQRAGWDAGTAGSLAKTASLAGEAPAQQAA